MKRLIIILALIPIITFGQAGKSPVVTTNTTQTITGQKNFTGTVKVGSDTSISLGALGYNSRLTGLLINKPVPVTYTTQNIFEVTHPTAGTPDWNLYSNDWVFTGVRGHGLYLKQNGNERLNMPQFGMAWEAPYAETDSITWWEQFMLFNDTPTSAEYSVRPLSVATKRYGKVAPYTYTSSAVLMVDQFLITSEIQNAMVEFRTQTYGASADETTKAYGSLQNAFGNSMMYIQDSMWIFHSINNMGWLYQAKDDGSAKELMRIDNNNRLLLSPSTDIPIVFRSPVYGSIYWTDEAGTGTVPIYKESGTDRVYVGGQDGMVTNKIEVINMPQDTSGLESGQLYVDDLTGSVQYTFPENIVTNGTFTTWTGSGKSATPDGWTFAPEPRDTTKIYIEQSPTGKLHFVWDGSQTGASHYVIQPTSTVGVTYGYSFVVEAITDTALIYIVGNGITVASTGTYSGSYESIANEKFKIFPKYGAGEITLDNFKLWVVGGNIDAPSYDVPIILDSLGQWVLPDTVGITDGYVAKYLGGELVWSPDVSTSGSGLFNPDGITIDTTAGGLARVLPAKVTKWDSVSVKLNKADSTIYLTPYDARTEFLQISDSTIYLTPSDAASAYATKSHTHTEFFDTLSYSVNIPDTVIAGDNAIWKVPNNITIVEVSAFTNSGTVTFNIEERGETTPNTAGTDVMTSDLVADTDQQETTTFSNATLDKNDWMALVITSITGDPTLFGVTIYYVKTN